MNTLLLDQTTWDLVADAAGNIAMATNPYAQAQDAASAIKTFRGEVYYDKRIGLPYFTQILGQRPSISLIKSLMSNAVLASTPGGVPGVVSAQCFLTALTPARQLTGQVQITNSSGQTSATNF